MIIDFHTHVGDFRQRDDTTREPVTWDGLIARLDEEGIDKAVLLPVVPSPENAFAPEMTYGECMTIREQVLKAGECAERLIVFGNMDPRWMGNRPNADFGPVLDWFQEHGCQGIGEIVANVPFDDERNLNLFRQIGDRGVPVVFHGTGFGGGTYGLQDDPGAPRLERLLQEAPDTIIVGHGPGFWAEMAAGVTEPEKMGYPEGPIAEEGALPRLLREHPNLYGDLSAGSGHNAFTRDPEYGVGFLEEFQNQLLFGTDVCFGGEADRMPHLTTLTGWLVEGKVSQEVFDKIAWRNAVRILPAG